MAGACAAERDAVPCRPPRRRGAGEAGPYRERCSETVATGHHEMSPTCRMKNGATVCRTSPPDPSRAVLTTQRISCGVYDRRIDVAPSLAFRLLRNGQTKP